MEYIGAGHKPVLFFIDLCNAYNSVSRKKLY